MDPETPLYFCNGRLLFCGSSAESVEEGAAFEGKNRILGHPSVTMELPRFIETGSAPGCVSRRSSIGSRSSSRSSTARPAWRSRTAARPWWSRSCPGRTAGRSAPVAAGVAAAYDRLEERRFEFVPLWGILVFLAYRMRRVDCPRCGVTVEMVPWCDGKNQLTTTYRWFLATWARRLSWSEVGLDLPHVVGQRLPGGGARRRVGPGAPRPERGDGRGHRRGRLEPRAHVPDAASTTSAAEHEAAAGRGRGADRGEPAIVPGRASARRSASGCKYVCSDMWKPYLNVIAERLGQAVHVLDRFHVMQKFGKALDEIRAEEVEAAEAGRLRAGAEAVAVVLPEAAGEPDGQADGEAVGVAEVQPADGAGVPAAGGLPAALGVQERVRGRGSSWTSGRAGDAIAAGADEEGRPDDPVASAADPELVPGPRARSRRGPWRGSTTR